MAQFFTCECYEKCVTWRGENQLTWRGKGYSKTKAAWNGKKGKCDEKGMSFWKRAVAWNTMNRVRLIWTDPNLGTEFGSNCIVLVILSSVQTSRDLIAEKIMGKDAQKHQHHMQVLCSLFCSGKQENSPLTSVYSLKTCHTLRNSCKIIRKQSFISFCLEVLF